MSSVSALNVLFFSNYRNEHEIRYDIQHNILRRPRHKMYLVIDIRFVRRYPLYNLSGPSFKCLCLLIYSDNISFLCRKRILFHADARLLFANPKIDLCKYELAHARACLNEMNFD